MGKLTVTEENPRYSSSNAIIVARGDRHASLTINGGNISATGVDMTGENGESYAIYSENLTVKGGTVTATGGNVEATDAAYSSGIYATKLTDIQNCTVTATGGKAESEGYASSCGIAVSSDRFRVLKLNRSTVTATGGDATANSTQCDNPAYSTGIDAYCQVTISDSTVNATGGSVKSYDNGISTGFGTYSMTISGGTVTATGGDATSTAVSPESSYSNASSDGISVNDVFTVTGGSVITGSGTASVAFSDGWVESAGITAGTLVVSGGSIRLPVNSLVYAVEVSGEVKLVDLLPTGCAFWRGKTTVTGDDISGYQYDYEELGFVTLGDKTQLAAGVSPVYYDYTVKTCTHSAETGTCEYCGKNLDANTGDIIFVPTTSTTVTNPDGSTTTTTVNSQTGTVTETTKNPDGTTGTTTTDKNGTVTGVSANVPANAAKDGQTVPLPVGAVQPGSGTTINVNVPAGGATVEIPVKNPTPGTVIVIVNADGSETVIPGSKITENGITVTLTGSATIRVIDNSRTFSDVKERDYFSAAVQWAAARGITGGTSATTFGPHESCTRAQLVTFLWRAAGQPKASGDSGMTDVAASAYYAQAVAWAFENGIVGDYDSVSDYAVAAVQWAVNAGIIQGADGKLMPQEPCTRARIVAMLYRLLGE